MIISPELIAHVGLHIFNQPGVRETIYGLAIKGVGVIITIISPYILPALKVIGVVLSAILIADLTYEVAKWILNKVS